MDSLGNIDLAGFFPTEIAKWLKEYQIPSFRAQQIFHWIHRQAVISFQEMSNLPADLIRLLEKQFITPLPLTIALTRTSSDGTEKYLFSLTDGHTLETVLIPDKERQTVCVSSQVGCAMGCSFCATGQAGFVRHLSAGELAGQVLWVENLLRKRSLAVTNVVFMGMGEPLANYDAVLKSIRLLNTPAGLNLGMRRFTLSTCGLVPQILKLAREGLPLNLAISLHATTDNLRSQIMPINKRFPLAELFSACRSYQEKTGRRISFEYALIRDFNDDLKAARELTNLLSGLLGHVNLIPVNPVGGEEPPEARKIAEFARVLENSSIPVTVRKERGADIEAACGQLRQINYRP